MADSLVCLNFHLCQERGGSFTSPMNSHTYWSIPTCTHPPVQLSGLSCWKNLMKVYLYQQLCKVTWWRAFWGMGTQGIMDAIPTHRLSTYCIETWDIYTVPWVSWTERGPLSGLHATLLTGPDKTLSMTTLLAINEIMYMPVYTHIYNLYIQCVHNQSCWSSVACMAYIIYIYIYI